jgi:hypothetical protein
MGQPVTDWNSFEAIPQKCSNTTVQEVEEARDRSGLLQPGCLFMAGWERSGTSNSSPGALQGAVKLGVSVLVSKYRVFRTQAGRILTQVPRRKIPRLLAAQNGSKTAGIVNEN